MESKQIETSSHFQEVKEGHHSKSDHLGEMEFISSRSDQPILRGVAGVIS